MSKPATGFMETATIAAVAAGDLINRNLGKLSSGDINIKQASDFVTRVDRESEDLIVSTINQKYPDHRFLAEESSRDQGGPGYRWIIDPLDGTTNFIHGYPAFAVSVALEYDGEIILGLVYDPLRKEIFTAEKGKGAFLNGRPVRVSSTGDMSSGLIATGFPFKKRDMLDHYLDLFRRIFGQVSDIRRAGSAALDLAHLASGRCDGFFELFLGAWDIAAGSIIIKEAGGIVTDFGGGDDYLDTGNIIASTPALYDNLLNDVLTVFSGVIDK